MPETADLVKESRISRGSRVQLASFTALFFYWLYQRVASEHISAILANKWLLICSGFVVFQLRDSFDWHPRTRQALRILGWILLLLTAVYLIRVGW